jgi:hypothetical protein
MVSGSFMKGTATGPLFIVFGLFHALSGIPMRRGLHLSTVIIGLIAIVVSLMNYAMLRDGDMKFPRQVFKEIPKQYYRGVSYLFFENAGNLETSRKYLAKRYETITTAQSSGQTKGLHQKIEEYQIAIDFYNAAKPRFQP